MSDITLNPEESGGYARLRNFDEPGVGSAIALSFDLTTVTAAVGRLASAGAATPNTLSGDMDRLHLKTNIANAFSLSGVRFRRGEQSYVVKANGALQINPSPVTGNGTTVGSMTAGQGEVLLDEWTAGTPPQVTDWTGVAGAPINGVDTPFGTYAVVFRVPTAPLRPSSFSVLGTMKDGTTFNVSADSNGYINTTRIKGRVNYTTGVVTLVGVTPTSPGGQDPTDLSFLNIPGLTTGFIDLIQQETLRYNATAYTYLPMEASLLGINPVRLPSDGRVPIFRPWWAWC